MILTLWIAAGGRRKALLPRQAGIAGRSLWRWKRARPGWLLWRVVGSRSLLREAPWWREAGLAHRSLGGWIIRSRSLLREAGLAHRSLRRWIIRSRALLWIAP